MSLLMLTRPQKSKSAKKADTSKAVNTSSVGESYIALGKSKRATVSAFGKGVYLNLREYYVDKASGEEKPGKKGITLTLEQWETLKEHADEIDRAFSAISTTK
jgi:hypothetical protein